MVHILLKAIDPHTLALGLTERAGPLVRAVARESVDSVDAVSSVLTGIAQALVDILVTVESLPSGVAVASVTRSPGGGLSSPCEAFVVKNQTLKKRFLKVKV